MLKLGRQRFDDNTPLMMAIVNRTPDSFFDKGATWTEDAAIARVADGVVVGSAIVDIIAEHGHAAASHVQAYVATLADAVHTARGATQ